jgi:hypothetical protein
MFSSRLSRLHRASSHPPNCNPERSEGSAFLSPYLTVASSHRSSSIPVFSTASIVRAHRKAHLPRGGARGNPSLLMVLLHGPLDTPGGRLFATTWPSFAPSRAGVFFRFRCLVPSLEHPPTAIPFTIRTYPKYAHNSFRIRTSKTRDLESFRIRTYRKTGEGALRLGWISDLSTSRLSVAHSMLRPAL